MLRPSRCVHQCGQRDSDQTAGVDGDFCENDRLHEVLETKAASSLVAESDRVHELLETMDASSLVAETDRLHAVLESTAAPSLAAETDQLHVESESSGACVCCASWCGRVGGLRLRRQAHSRSGNFVVDSSASSHHVDMSIHEMLVAHMVSMSCMVHARIHVWVTHAARVNSCRIAQCTREFRGTY